MKAGASHRKVQLTKGGGVCRGRPCASGHKARARLLVGGNRKTVAMDVMALMDDVLHALHESRNAYK